MKLKILCIAPFTELAKSIKQVSSEYENIECDIYVGDLEQGRKIVENLDTKDYDIIISRGGTAELIREHTNIPVIDIEISIYDILTALKLAENYSDSIAIIAYPNVTKYIYLIANLYNYDYKIVTIHTPDDADNALNSIKNKVDIVLCDAITNKLAMEKSINTILITSGVSSIQNAFEEAIKIGDILKKQKALLSILSKELSDKKTFYIITDRNFTVLQSNVDYNFQKVILNSQKIYNLEKDNLKCRIKYENNTYEINLVRLDYYNEFNKITIRKLNTLKTSIRNGVIKHNKENIQNLLNTSLNKYNLYPKETLIQVKESNEICNSIIIYGEYGTGKKNLAYKYFMDLKHRCDFLFEIDCELLDNKTWKYLLNPKDGPLLLENNTLFFDNFETLDKNNVNKLVYTINNTKLLNTNNLIISCNTSKGANNINIFKYKINSYEIQLPPLRNRTNELNNIITLLVNKLNIENNTNIVGFEPKAINDLIEYDWPYNFNQLISGLKELMINSDVQYITHDSVLNLISNFKTNDSISQADNTSLMASHDLTLDDYIKKIIESKLEENDYNQTVTARKLGISRTTLWRKLNN